MWQSLLVLAPHPDDETLGCGGLISRMVETGNRVTVAVFASVTDDRFEELTAASHILGFDVDVTCQADGFFLSDVSDEELCSRVENLLRYHRPEVLAVPQGAARHHEHRRVRDAAIAACRPRAVRNGPRLLLGYELATDYRPIVDLFVRLEASDVAVKTEAMYAHASQLPDGDSERAEDALTALARLRGAQAGVRYAEGYEVVQWTV